MPEVGWEDLVRKVEAARVRNAAEQVANPAPSASVEPATASEPTDERGCTGENFNFVIWLGDYSKQDADDSWDAGFKDPQWVTKGCGDFLEFNRRGRDFDSVAVGAFNECLSYNLDPQCVQQFTPDGFLDQARKPVELVVASGMSTTRQSHWVPVAGYGPRGPR